MWDFPFAVKTGLRIIATPFVCARAAPRSGNRTRIR
jgi:hypothetical protein